MGNFLSFGPEETSIDFDDFNIIVGPNSSGKTNLLRSLQVVERALGQSGLGQVTAFYHVATESFTVEATFDLNHEEAEAIADFLVCEPLNESVSPVDGETQPAAQAHATSIAISFHQQLARSFDRVSFLVRARGGTSQNVRIYLRVGRSGKELFINPFGTVTLKPLDAVSGPTVGWARFLIDSAKPSSDRMPNETLLETVHRSLSGTYVALQIPQWLQLDQVERSENVGSFAANIRRFMESRGIFSASVTIPDLLRGIYSGAFRVLYEDRFRPRGFTKLPSTIQNAPASQPPPASADLNILLYRLKMSAETQERERYAKIKEEFRRLAGQEHDFDVVQRTQTQAAPNVAPGTTRIGLAYEIGITVKTAKGWIGLDFAAAGLLELILILTAVIGERDRILLLDEPALNLHPGKQLELLRLLEEGTSDSQVIMITHSPYLVSEKRVGQVLRLQREADATKVYRLKKKNSAFRAKLAKEIRRNPAIKLALFSAGVILVEGDDEEAALPVWLSKCTPPVDLIERNVIVANSHGDSSLLTYSQIFDSWHVPNVIVCDKKALKRIPRLRKRAISFMDDDFMDLIRKANPARYEKAERALGPGWKRKNPNVARDVAENTKAPPVVEELAVGITSKLDLK